MQKLGILFTIILSVAAHAKSQMVFMMEKGTEKQILMADGDGKKPEALTSGTLWHLYPAIDSIGKSVAYVEGTNDGNKVVLNLVSLDLEKRTTEQWTESTGMVLHPVFSGDGRFLSYTAPLGPDGRSQIAILDLVKERKKGPGICKVQLAGRVCYQTTPQVIPADYPSYFPAISSDGGFVIYQRTKSQTKKDIVLKNFFTDQEVQLTDPEGNSMAPSLSFDDRYVAMTSLVDKNWDVYLYDRETKKTIRLTTNAAQDFAPTFRADGSVLFASNRTGHFGLYEISASEIKKGTFGETAILVAADADYYAPSVSGELKFSQSLLPQMFQPSRSSFGAIRLGDRVYVAGGHQGKEHTYPKESFTGRVEYFETATNEWKEAAPRLTPCHGFMLAGIGKYLYAFGGFAYSDEYDPKWKSLDVIERYDTTQDRWEVIGQMPHRRSSYALGVVGTKVFLMGGWDSTPKFKGDLDGTFRTEIDVFDLLSEKMETLPTTLPLPLRRALSTVVIGDEIFLVGGLGQGASHFELLDRVTAFNAVTGIWRELPSLPFATFAPAAGIIGNELFVFGGMFKLDTKSYNYVNHIFALNLKTSLWSHTGRFLSETKGFSQVVNLDDKTLGILGGHSYQEETDAPVLTFEKFSVK